MASSCDFLEKNYFLCSRCKHLYRRSGDITYRVTTPWRWGVPAKSFFSSLRFLHLRYHRQEVPF